MPIYPQTNVVPSTARTASGNSGNLSAPPNCNARFLFSVSAVSGTSPTLQILIFSILKSTAESYIIATASLTAVVSGSLVVENLPTTYRINWTIGGTTPSFTFEVDVQFQDQ